jgi:hypothetical protein
MNADLSKKWLKFYPKSALIVHPPRAGMTGHRRFKGSKSKLVKGQNISMPAAEDQPDSAELLRRSIKPGRINSPQRVHKTRLAPGLEHRSWQDGLKMHRFRCVSDALRLADADLRATVRPYKLLTRNGNQG